ncbi:hypothetical protein [Aliivibrio fischeri]|uniref:hypothetical protein n=1 Tax=Aliivibrio fischeri TaxID=668 RepID=UPI0007C5C52B|nr:hypothetical protein [Aliivibrio fischeri]
MAKVVIDGKCPYCGSAQGYMQRYVQSVTQYYGFEGEPIEASVVNHRGGTKKYCSNCERKLIIPNNQTEK